MGLRTPPSPIRFPRKAICDQCGKPFETLADDTTCTQCMIKPSRRPTDFPPVPKEIIMSDFSNTIRKKKVCVDCMKEFVPTGNCQMRCPECAAKKNSATHPKTAKVRTPHHFGKDIQPSNAAITRTIRKGEPVDAKDFGDIQPSKAATTLIAASPAITVACTMHDTVAVFRALADAGCTCLVFANMKIEIEAL